VVELAIEPAPELAAELAVEAAELEIADDETSEDEDEDANINLAPSTPLLKEAVPTLPFR
jgi:hypothetical protein